MSERCSRQIALVQRRIVRLCEDLAASGNQPRSVLDVGCWDGETTLRYATALGGPASGIEIFERPAADARRRGIDVAAIDLERDAFPWRDESFDVVVVNQVFEHLKNVWLPMSEVLRVLRVDGHAIVSVPNLASLHNRLMLAVGLQPSSIRTLGPHVRGYTFGEFRRFVELGGALHVERALGVGFYPLPARWSTPLSALWPAGSHTTLLLTRKLRRAAPSPWLAYLSETRADGLQTFYVE
jgi:methionine biosynthesis protein MetW